jgi:hypothetical protein
MWLAKARRPTLSVILKRKDLPKTVHIFPLNSLSFSHVSFFLFELCSWILCYAFKSAANTVAGAIIVVVVALVHSAAVNFPVMENYADF